MWYIHNNIKSKYDRQILITPKCWAYKYKMTQIIHDISLDILDFIYQHNTAKGHHTK